MSLDVTLSSGFTANITHNLNKMADEAGIYGVVWRPEENDVKTAADIIPTLERGLIDMIERPAHYRKFNAENGWGTYDNFVVWLLKYLIACYENPDATVTACR